MYAFPSGTSLLFGFFLAFAAGFADDAASFLSAFSSFFSDFADFSPSAAFAFGAFSISARRPAGVDAY